MIAASIWSLLIPSIEMAESQNIVAWIPATVGFLLGIGFLLLLDSVIPHMHLDSDNPEGVRSSLSKNTMLVLAVTLHNIPEGMAVGVTFVGAISDNTRITGCRCIGSCGRYCNTEFSRGGNNFTSAPCRRSVTQKVMLSRNYVGSCRAYRCCAYGDFCRNSSPVVAVLLSFAAGAMIYVVTEELIPESQNGQTFQHGTIGVAIGFTLMMVLDVALG